MSRIATIFEGRLEEGFAARNHIARRAAFGGCSFRCCLIKIIRKILLFERHAQCMVKRFFVLVLLFVTTSLSAQSLHLTGSVKSSDGKPVPNASIELREQNTGARSKTASDHDGSYLFHGLKVGMYQATVQAQGFKTLTRDGIRVTSETKLELNLTLEPSGKSP